MFDKKTVFVRLKNYFPKLQKELIEQEQFKVVSLNNLLKENCVEYVVQRLLQGNKKAMEFVIRSKFESDKPSAVLVWNDWIGFEKALVDLAKEYKVPTVLLLHGFPSHKRFESKSTRWHEQEERERWNNTDYFFVWDGEIRDFFVKSGFSSKKFFVVGDLVLGNYDREKIFGLVEAIANGGRACETVD